LWDDASGTENGGHLFNEKVVVAAPARAQAWGLSNAAMQADFDAETNFTLFQPVPVPMPHKATNGRRSVIARIRPNEDLLTSIETICEKHGFAAAAIRGSVGSTVGVRFEDGRVVDDIATEVMVLRGAVNTTASGPRAALEIALIDPRGHVHRGRIQRGANAVLICFELVLEEVLPAERSAQ
jgi:predicted DNA-binding protein with PD1-like motif